MVRVGECLVMRICKYFRKLKDKIIGNYIKRHPELIPEQEPINIPIIRTTKEPVLLTVQHVISEYQMMEFYYHDIDVFEEIKKYQIPKAFAESEDFRKLINYKKLTGNNGECIIRASVELLKEKEE